MTPTPDDDEPDLPPLAHRVRLNDDGSFDELVVSTPKGDALIHAEMMDRRAIFVSIGPMSIWAWVNEEGVVEITGTETCEGNADR